MQLARFLVEAVIRGKQSPNQLVREHPISRSWFYELLARYRRDRPAGLEPRSHRPTSSPHQVDQAVVDAILQLRAQLSAAGLDCGAQTILHHLANRFPSPPSRVTVWRILKRHGLVTPEPHKRPRASFVRFEAQLPNELWQTDATEWDLADSSKLEILNLIDDHSRLCLASVAVRTLKAADALQTFYSAVEEFGLLARFLSDNAAVFSGKSRGGRVALGSELDRLGVQCVHSMPYHPQTCGSFCAQFRRPSCPPVSFCFLRVPRMRETSVTTIGAHRAWATMSAIHSSGADRVICTKKSGGHLCM